MKKIFFVLFLMVGLSALYSQSADVVTEILNTSKVTYGQVCYLSAVHQNLVEETATYEESISAIFNAKQIDKEYDAAEPVRLETISYIYMKMWPKEKGGIMYRASKGSKRYSYKLLKDYGILLSNSDPWQYVSGREALNILTACMLEFDPVNEGMSLAIEDETSKKKSKKAKKAAETVTAEELAASEENTEKEGE